MEITIAVAATYYKVNLAEPVGISITLQHGTGNPNCFNAANPLFEPVVAYSFVGDTRQGGAVNFYNTTTNPHGNGTHTECVGHIAKERIYINDCLQQYHYIAQLITVTPILHNSDTVITAKHLANKILPNTNTLIIRTLPNTINKTIQNYSNTNPTYFTKDAIQCLVDAGIVHLLTDLPSVDKEQDGGKLLAHHEYWQYPNNTRLHATITEMVYVDNAIVDGIYFLNMQILNIKLDASSSNIVLYKLQEINQ